MLVVKRKYTFELRTMKNIPTVVNDPFGFSGLLLQTRVL